MRLFSTIATLGTAQDITLAELRIELFFPMDAATAELAQRLADADVERVEPVEISRR